MPVLLDVASALEGMGDQNPFLSESKPEITVNRSAQFRQGASSRRDFVPTPRDFVPFFSMAFSRREMREGLSFDRAVAE